MLPIIYQQIALIKLKKNPIIQRKRQPTEENQIPQSIAFSLHINRSKTVPSNRRSESNIQIKNGATWLFSAKP